MYFVDQFRGEKKRVAALERCLVYRESMLFLFLKLPVFRFFFLQNLLIQKVQYNHPNRIMKFPCVLSYSVNSGSRPCRRSFPNR